jgi:hypothetical protein
MRDNNLDVNFRDLSAMSADVLSISFARNGSPMLLLTADLEVQAFCQELPPLRPVLPPEPAVKPPPQTWYPLNTYSYCGAFPYEGVNGNSFDDITFNPATG